MRAKSQLMFCPHSFTHACIYSMIHPCKYVSSMYYVPGTVLLPNSFDVVRNQDGDGSKKEFEHPLMLNPFGKASLLGTRSESSANWLMCLHLCICYLFSWLPTTVSPVQHFTQKRTLCRTFKEIFFFSTLITHK